ncbi:MAG TPA: DUF1540 domain-containing protein [Candidatus Coproplasma excrementigallinarum]|uniref:DUF1540 domain-containing protein n=1 Tax=Candidatus Coproplasma excrementigallinarum TaxID=2840747 RepID=A0A9D1MK91_9FIRM|nr:DUF1540 domain-containing protein [Candidatus Coproplasma excrementigallinarum]
MDSVNSGVACDVRNCKYNSQGKNCTLNKIQIGCGSEECTCCESFSEKNY